MSKIVFVVWNSQFMKKAAEEALNELEHELKKQDLEIVIRDVQSVNWKNDCSDLLNEKADLYVIYQMGKGDWEKELAEKARVLAFKSSIDSFSIVKPNSELYRKLYMYLAYDGLENLKNFILSCISLLNIENIEVRRKKDPVKMPWSGIYHPLSEKHFESYGEYERWYRKNAGDADRKAAILFYRARYLFGNTAHVDLLIEELEKRGIMPVPVFCLTFPDKDAGMPGVEHAIEKYILPSKPEVLVWGLYFRVSRDMELLRKLNVPVLNAIELYSMSPEEWEKSEGMNPTTLSMAVALPEFDGTINPTVFSGEIRTPDILKAVPIEDRVKKIAEYVERWIDLRRKRRSERKVAIILHCSTTGNSEANSGTALGLDSFESVLEILRAMKEQGYDVRIPDKDELVNSLQAAWAGKWGDGKGEEKISKEDYLSWFHTLPEKVRRDVEEHWSLKEIKIPGVWLGKVFVTVQPLRTENDAEDYHRLIHDPVLPPPHTYLAFYSFINGFDAAVHVGKHGSVEWLPGKSCGLSNCCYPDICMQTVPNAYIYIVNNPAEGTQAKRRGYATIVDHLPPVMESSELYDDLEMALEDYFKARERGLKDQVNVLRERIIELAKKHRFLEESEGNGELNEKFDDFARELHSKIENINCSLFNLGLHVFGKVRDFEKIALSAVRPELRLKVRSVEERKKVRETFLSLIESLISSNASPDKIDKIADIADRAYFRKLGEELGVDAGEFERCILDGLEVVERLRRTAELECLLKFLDGGFVEPAPSGDLTRGRLEVIPTGYNFYSVDPKAIPTKSAWEVGKKLAEKLIKKFEEEEGKLPETVAFVQWTSDPMNTDGEQIAQILYTLGVRPVWDGRRVSSLEVIPLEELGRPRIDVFLRISGLFRDTFMNLVELVDRAVAMVSALDEPFEMNYVKKHTVEGVKHRIFGDMPGAYGAGVNHAVNSSAWESRDDLAEVFIEWGMYAYGDGVYGEADREGMLRAMKNVDTVVRNHYTDEWDIFSDDCPYAFQAGLGLAVEKVRGKRPKLYIMDTRPAPGEKGKVVDVKEEVERVARITLLNDRWVEGMKSHGYKGAGDMMKRIVNMFGWEATADAVEDWIFEEVAEKYVLDEEMRKWFLENNPYAVEEIARRLIEAHRRGLWNAREETLERLEEVYFEIEGYLEE